MVSGQWSVVSGQWSVVSGGAELDRDGGACVCRRNWLCRQQYKIHVSEAVIAECSAGDPTAVQERLDRLVDIPVLDVSEEAEALAATLMKQVPLPERAEVDALHIAIASVNGIDYLLTWNCAHIANAVLQARIQAIVRAAGLEPPTICTPQPLMEG